MSNADQIMAWPEPRFVTCPDCDGLGETPIGVWVHEPGCGYGHWADDAVPCQTCAGTGRAAREVRPVERDDDLREIESRARAYHPPPTRGERR